ncbi:MAG: TetR/AcrR family transcriptional regulator [Methylococcales bacterium]|nr:TetR/AcrR family transcriptional regulator [Methylococcales bacterium]
MPRHNRHSPEQLRTLLLNAADTILNEEGVSALTARRVAAEIGYTVAGIYKVFPSMTALMQALNHATLAQLVEELSVHLEQQPFKPHHVAELGLAYWRFSQQHAARWRLLFSPPPEHVPDDYRAAFAALDQVFIQACLALDAKQGDAPGLALSRALSGLLLHYEQVQPKPRHPVALDKLIRLTCLQFAKM